MNLRYIDLDENLLTRGSDGTYYRLRIGQDDWIDSPRDWSPLGHMLEGLNNEKFIFSVGYGEEIQ